MKNLPVSASLKLNAIGKSWRHGAIRLICLAVFLILPAACRVDSAPTVTDPTAVPPPVSATPTASPRLTAVRDASETTGGYSLYTAPVWPADPAQPITIEPGNG